MARTKLQCEDCGTWCEIAPDRERVRCECGDFYVVTTTKIPKLESTGHSHSEAE